MSTLKKDLVHIVGLLGLAAAVVVGVVSLPKHPPTVEANVGGKMVGIVQPTFRAGHVSGKGGFAWLPTCSEKYQLQWVGVAPRGYYCEPRK